ncbi:peptidase u61 ld-carboxypeptidase a [Thozetella sp. PMI_491]|nr:peptidase u61 ld-carboxypeptidase a [Thozetella sp. PMI_491]
MAPPPPLMAKALEQGATIALISPSARLNHLMPAVLARAEALLTARGYRVRTIYTLDTGIQSSIENRLSEIRAAFFDPAVSLIITTIGGTTFTELLPRLMADTELHEQIKAHPKLVAGYSDISGLHWFLNAFTGLRTFYAPCIFPELGEANSVDDETSPLAFCVKNFFAAIEKREPIGDVARSLTYAPEDSPYFKEPESTASPKLAPTSGWKWLRGGKAQGRLFGGCLSVVARLQGMPRISPDWRDRIVFLETASGDNDVLAPPLARVQAAFADLIASGVFEQAAGLVVGRPIGYDSEEDKERYAGVIKELLCEGPQTNEFPILFNVDIGHTTPMVTLPYDALAELDSERDRFAILESTVI